MLEFTARTLVSLSQRGYTELERIISSARDMINACRWPLAREAMGTNAISAGSSSAINQWISSLTMSAERAT